MNFRIIVGLLVVSCAAGARIKEKEFAHEDQESARDWPESSRDKRKCAACSAMWSTFQQGVNAGNNMARRQFFIKGGGNLDSLRSKCTNIPEIREKYESDCVDVITKSQKMDTIPNCWDATTPEHFCGCLVGRDTAIGKKRCPGGAGGAPKDAKKPKKPKNDQAAAKPKPNAVKPKPAKLDMGDGSSNGGWPSFSRDKRQCGICKAFFPTFLKGVNQGDNMARRQFFLKNGGNLDGLRPQCSKIEGLSKRHEGDCNTVIRNSQSQSIVPICWAFSDAESFCGCLVGGGNAGGNVRQCP